MNNKDNPNSSVYIPCEYVSFWDGFGEVSSPAKYDPVNNKVYDVELADLSDEELSECEILVGEYMDLLGKRFILGERSHDDTWTVENPDPRYVISGMSDLCSKPSLISQIESASSRATGAHPTDKAAVKEPTFER